MPTVKPPPRPVIRTTTHRDMVRRAEGPREFARRNRYVEYEFGGGGRRPKRKFWGDAGSNG